MFLKFLKHDSYCLHCLSTPGNNSQLVPVHTPLSHFLKVQKVTAGDCRGQLCLCWALSEQTRGHIL